MPLYTYDDGTGPKLLVDNGALAIDEACCCDGADCWVLRRCDELSECSKGGYGDPAVDGYCEPPMPLTIYVTFSGLAGDFATFNGTHAVSMGGPTNCVWDFSIIGGIIIGYNNSGYWEIYLNPFTDDCNIRIDGPAEPTGCDPRGTFTFDIASCLDSACADTLSCENSVGATAVIDYVDPGMTLGVNDLVVTDDLTTQFAAGTIIRYNNVCYTILGQIPCSQGSPVTMTSWEEWPTCETCENPTYWNIIRTTRYADRAPHGSCTNPPSDTFNFTYEPYQGIPPAGWGNCDAGDQYRREWIAGPYATQVEAYDYFKGFGCESGNPPPEAFVRWNVQSQKSPYPNPLPNPAVCDETTPYRYVQHTLTSTEIGYGCVDNSFGGGDLCIYWWSHHTVNTVADLYAIAAQYVTDYGPHGPPWNPV